MIMSLKKKNMFTYQKLNYIHTDQQECLPNPGDKTKPLFPLPPPDQWAGREDECNNTEVRTTACGLPHMLMFLLPVLGILKIQDKLLYSRHFCIHCLNCHDSCHVVKIYTISPPHSYGVLNGGVDTNQVNKITQFIH